MKLTVEDLGRIKRAELDIRPLTVFAGENGTNKTWTAYGLFALCEALRLDAQRRPKHFRAPVELEIALLERSNRLRREVSSLAPSTSLVKVIRKADLFEAGPPDMLRFSLLAPGVRQAVAADVDETCAVSLEMQGSELLSGRASALRLTISAADQSILAEYLDEEASEVLAGGAYDLDGLEDILGHFALGRFGAVRCLPAERKLLAQIYPAIMAPDQDAGRNLPRPLVDFAYMMALGSTQRSREVGAGRWLDDLAKVVGGTYLFDKSRSAGIQFSPRGGPPLPLRGSASFAKSLAGLAVFLRRAAPGDILFIDEPEMNAHPRAQAALLELLTMLVRRGLRVVLTTHSPYFIDHLTNLMTGATLPPDKRAELAPRLYLGDDAALIDAEDVAVYVFEESDQEVKPRLAIDRSTPEIDWSTFSTVSDDVSNLLSDILAMKRGSDE